MAPGTRFCSKCGLNFATAEHPTQGTDADAEIFRRLAASLTEYSFERELGRGGMATVYLATDPRHDRKVAIKVLNPDLAASIGAERFEREIRLAARLQHPNILGLYDSGVADGLLYYVMPFVEGESLRDRLDREGQLPVDDALQLTLQVADALAAAHAQGVVHRDIKPENILLAQGHALVADFGVARAATEGGAAKLTQTGMAIGTPTYMAPEQAGGEQVGPQADLYSLGCVLYEMLAGEPPFTGKNSMAVMARHAMEQVPSIRIVRPTVPEEVEEAIFAVLAKVAADRPRSAMEFAELLALPFGAVAGRRTRGSLTMRRTSVPGAFPPYRAPAPWWGRPPALGAGALVLLVAAGLGWQAMGKGGPAAVGPEARRLAVLYFVDHSRDSSLTPLADGLTEGLIRSLGAGTALTVISQGGVAPYRGRDIRSDSVARALRVGYLVRGEVEPEASRVRVTLRLEDAGGATLKRASFMVAGEDVVALGDSVAVLAADLVRTELGTELGLRERRAGTRDNAAWLLAQRAEATLKRAEVIAGEGEGERAGAAFREADSLFALAAQRDPRWAEPALRRAFVAYRRSRLAGSEPAAVRPWVTAGVALTDSALALAPDDPDVLELRGTLRYWGWLVGLEADAARSRTLLLSAQGDLEKAVQLNPRQAGAYATLSHLYYQTGTPTDVNIAAQRALDADEFLVNAETILGRLFLSSYDLAQFDKGSQWCSEAQRRFPAGLLAVRCQLFLLTTRDREPDVAAAWRLADSIVAIAPPSRRPPPRFDADMMVAAVLARASRSVPALADSARHVARRSEGSAEVDPTRDLDYAAAFVYTLLGDYREAIRTLKVYLAANPQKSDGFRDDPGWWLRDLASDPAFRQLVRADAPR